jgi:hypothetical protein
LALYGKEGMVFASIRALTLNPLRNMKNGNSMLTRDSGVVRFL